MEEAVREQLDLSLFELSHAADGTLEGTLKPGLFAQHIVGFVSKLAETAPDCESTIRFYFGNYGTHIDQYDSQGCQLRIPNSDGQTVGVLAETVLAFIEGKVLAESFSVEPALVNWLFRHSDFGNPLAGIVVSSIIG